MRRRIAPLALDVAAASFLLLAGCEATPVDEESAPSSEVAAQAADRAGQRPMLNGLKGEFAPIVRLSGSMCSGQAELVGLGGVGSVMIDGALDTTQEEEPRSRGACAAEFDITVPAGFQIAPTVCATVALTGATEEARAKVRLRAAFPGESLISTTTQTFERFDGETVPICATFPQVITSGCSTTPSKHTLVVAVDLETSPQTHLLLKSIDADLTYADGSIFRQCSTRGLLPVASARDEACGGPNNHPCGAGLTCRRTRLTWGGTVGRCLNNADAQRPRAGGDMCGPTLTPGCAPDLICAMDGTQRNGENVGTCVSRVAGAGDACGPLVGRTCRTDLVCSELGRCESPSRPAPPVEGESCADARCVMGLTCDAETQRCRESRGTVGEACRPIATEERGIVECQEAFRCAGGTCRNVNAPAGASCVSDSECQSQNCDFAAQLCR